MRRLILATLMLGCGSSEKRAATPAFQAAGDSGPVPGVQSRHDPPVTPAPAPVPALDASVPTTASADAAVVDQRPSPDTVVAADARETPLGDGSALAAALHRFRYELPCKGTAFATTRDCPWDIAPWKALGGTSDSTSTLKAELVRSFGGDANVTYNVSVRVRGVVEPTKHVDDAGLVDTTRTSIPHLHVGGKLSSGHNAYFLTVSDPNQIYFWNSDHEEGLAVLVDYTATLRIKGGAKLTFAMSDTNNLVYTNSKMLVASGVPPAPMPFNGEFLQIDVLSVTP